MSKVRRKYVFRAGFIIAAVILVLVMGAMLYMNAVKGILEEDTRQYLSEVAQQGADAVNIQVDGEFQTLRAMAVLLGAQPIFDVNGSVELLKTEASFTPFKRMGLILPDGTAYATDDVRMDLSNRAYFQRALKGESSVSELLIDKVDGERIYVYATPVFHEAQIQAVLFASSTANAYSSVMDIRLFGGAGYAYIAQSNGDIALHPGHPDSIQDMNNIFDSLTYEVSTSNENIENMRSDMQAGRDGILEYTRLGEQRYLSYVPVGVNDWYIICVVSAATVSQKSNYLSGLALTTCLVVVAVVLSLSGYILYLQSKNKKELSQLAYTDKITGGYNWNGFEIQARLMLDQAQEYAMVIFDIDKFKVLNDMFGHAEGNRTLCCIWDILKNNLAKDEPFARISSDHFAAMIRYESKEQLTARLQTLICQIQKCSEESLSNYCIKLSFGVYHITDKSQDINLLNDRANVARRMVKGNDEIKVAFYNSSVRKQMIHEKNIEDEMADALASGEFEVYLQPKYSTENQGIVSAEALVRWNHPRNGLIPPNDFIPIFEKNGFVVNIDIFVLRKVCEKLQEWILAGITPVPIAVNMSRVHLHNTEFANKVFEIVNQFDVPCNLIELELTESTAIDFENIGQLTGIMNTLKAKGFTIAMDDFGAGYSSLNLLRRLPFDVLKLDRDFFSADTDTLRGKTVISDMVIMAKHLNMVVVAEGVETKEQVEFLTQTGCDIIQGYYFAKPMSMVNFDKLYAQK